MDDGLLLHDFSLPLGDVTGPVSDELEPGVVSVGDHRAEAEESSRCVRASVDCGHGDRRDQIKHRPQGTEDQLDLDPRDSEEALDDVENVEHQHDAGKPEGSHRHSVEVRAGREAGIPGRFNADEAHQIEDLGWRT